MAKRAGSPYKSSPSTKRNPSGKKEEEEEAKKLPP
jgi:hypothetical protein